MTLTVTKPVTGAPMGHGIRMRVHSTNVVASGETVSGVLRSSADATLQLARGSATFSTGSGDADIVWSTTNGGAGDFFPAFWNAGYVIGDALDVYLQHLSPAYAFIEDVLLTAYFVHDPVSQLPIALAAFAAFSGHDPMLDEILAAVRKTFSTF